MRLLLAIAVSVLGARANYGVHKYEMSLVFVSHHDCNQSRREICGFILLLYMDNK